jgi:hypothetical protein
MLCPLLRHGQIDIPLGSIGRLGHGCHSRPDAIVHLLGRDGDVVASIGRDDLSLNHRVTSSKRRQGVVAVHDHPPAQN